MSPLSKFSEIQWKSRQSPDAKLNLSKVTPVLANTILHIFMQHTVVGHTSMSRFEGFIALGTKQKTAHHIK